MRKPKLMVIGLDAVSLTMLDAFRSHCPAIHRLMRQGVTGRAIPVLPVYTPTNWAALSTGADTTKTFAAGWHNETTGRVLSTFDRRAIPCDTIFDSAARAGLRTLAISYPTGYPAKSPLNMVLAPLDRGLVSNALVPGKIVEVGQTFLSAAKGGQAGMPVPPAGEFRFVLLEALGAATGAALARAVGATEDGASVSSAKRRTAARTVEAVVRRDGRSGWRLSLAPDAEHARVALRHEEWSAPIRVDVVQPGRPGKCVVRVMMFDGGKRLAVSEAYDVGMLGEPAPLAAAVYDELGPPTEHSVFTKAAADLFNRGRGDRTITRLMRRDMTAQAEWIADAAALAQRIAPYDVFYLHHHYPDNVGHTYLQAASGGGRFTPRQRRLAKAALSTCLEICDDLVGALLGLAGPKTTVLLVSDHGNVPNRWNTSVRRRLIDLGLTREKGVRHLLCAGTLRAYRQKVPDPFFSVDRRRSLAWVSKDVSTWIDVNARAVRQAHGPERSRGTGTRRYEELQRKVIDALLDWKTPGGERVIAVALRRKDSHLLGYEGKHCGDVTFHYNSGFSWFGSPDREISEGTGANHGPQMPVTFSGLSDNLAFFVLKGPGFEKRGRFPLRRAYPPFRRGGSVRETSPLFEADGRWVRITDLVPTACRVAGVPPPVDATGAVRYDLMAKSL